MMVVPKTQRGYNASSPVTVMISDPLMQEAARIQIPR